MLNGFKRAVVTMLMLSMVLGLFVFTASAEDILLGDVDANQSVTTADARAILRHAVKIENLAESSLLAADVNQDGNITSADARGALRVAVRLDNAVTITTPDEPTEPTLPEDPTEPDIPEEPTRPGEPGDSAVVGQMAVETYRVPQGEDDCCYVMFITNNSNQLVQIEAASQKTPTVFIEGAKTAGTVTKDVNGLIAKNDAKEYAKTIIDILSDKERYLTLCENAYKDLYVNWDMVAQKVYDEYLKLIQNNLKKPQQDV